MARTHVSTALILDRPGIARQGRMQQCRADGSDSVCACRLRTALCAALPNVAAFVYMAKKVRNQTQSVCHYQSAVTLMCLSIMITKARAVDAYLTTCAGCGTALVGPAMHM